MVEEQKVCSSVPQLSRRQGELVYEICVYLYLKILFNNNSNSQFEFLPLGEIKRDFYEQTRITFKFQSLD